MYDDNDQYELSRYKWIFPLVVIILIVSLLLVKCSNNNLKGYVDSADESKGTEEITSSTGNLDADPVMEEESVLYSDEELGVSFSVPESWTKLLGEGHTVTFIDKKIGTQLNFTAVNYDPTVNMISEESLYQDIVSAGMEPREFKKDRFDEYSVSYVNSKYAYIEHTIWDRSMILTLSFTFDVNYYNDTKLNNMVQFIIQSVNWNKTYPIPDDLQLLYQEYGNFEFGLPKNWSYGESSNTILMTDPTQRAAITITVNEAATTLDNISQVDFVNFLAQTREGFMPKSYENDGTVIKCTGTYYNSDTLYNIQQYVMVANGYEYILSFDTDAEMTSDLAVTIQNEVNTFRIF